ncbi:hypothetical protein ACI79G_05050 [Geodermatophilus sp. SYSU D00779]
MAHRLTADGTPLVGQFLVHPAVDAEGEYPSRVGNAKAYFLEEDTMTGSTATTPEPGRTPRTPRTPGRPRCAAPT